MVKTVVWEFEVEAGLEVLELAAGTDVVAESTIVRGGEQPFALRYRLKCDGGWRVRELEIELLSGDRRVLELSADGFGRWTRGDGVALPELDGCIDVDLSATAFTNTLPVRRLELAPGDAREIALAYVDVPELTLERADQRYTRLGREGNGLRYRFESLEDGAVGYSNELTLDDDALVVAYPGYAHRLFR
jgi:uncharacterized protein